jgi:hypothetical protein
MNDLNTLDGSELDAQRVEQTRALLREEPELSRWKLSRRLAQEWGFYSPLGQLRDMAVRTWLLKMETAEELVLPARRRVAPNRMRHRKVPEVPHDQGMLNESLAEIGSVWIQEVSKDPQEGALFDCLLHRYHYLSYRSAVGLNLKYLVRDAQGRPLACLLFGAAAWRCAARDRWIGWSEEQRRQRVNLITNNTRFLVLPWVEVRHLASHLLARVRARLRLDWRAKYGQEVFLLETFVNPERFRGTCYRAAGWIRAGQTQGRGRDDRHHQLRVPHKDVYLQPLCARWKEALCQ